MINESDRSIVARKYIDELNQQLSSGQAREHAYRPALQRLMNGFDDVTAVNDPARSENGNPDFVFIKTSNSDIILGYAEAKDITVDLDRVLDTEQIRRYSGYEKLLLTNYRDFIFLASGEEYLRISIGHLGEKALEVNSTQVLRLVSELEAFLAKKPEAIKSGKRLAVIMGGKARRIRDNVAQYLENKENERNIELEQIYGLMKTLLVHDLKQNDFADLYAQTLVYGLFAARYNDDTLDNFDRREAVEAVPRTNPFLRQFFNHIAGADFDTRLRYIVDELCEVLAISDVRSLVRHQATKFAVDDEQDLTIHFYEDFLKEYDPVMRRKMGVYYTPVPIVRYIVRAVDRVLKDEFGITKGLSSDQIIAHTINTQPWRKKGERKDRLTKDIQVPRVQVLDPAVGTATFLNEIIRHIYKDFEGQEGRWSSYVKDNLIKRLHGFELMMAPYTIAHLKLSMTLRETGVDNITDRLGVYLTNTLEEGVPIQQDLLSLLGLAGAVSEESKHAADIKTNQPIMVVVGNPPYSVSSSNKSDWIQKLIRDYKKDLGERKINLDDDYIKFIRFAESMIAKNGSGVVAMITNNSYIDGITHRQMRKHLRQTFDKIYVLDLHGNSKKKEISPDGSLDQNVFEIMQGVSIVIMVKVSGQSDLADVYHAELWGNRKHKFNELNSDGPRFVKIDSREPNYFFVPKDNSLIAEYEVGVSLNNLFINKASGFRSGQDNVQVTWTRSQIEKVVGDLINLSEHEYRVKYNLKDGRNHNYQGMIADVGDSIDDWRVIETLYRPFDIRWTYYSKKSSGFVAWPRNKTMNHFVGHKNIGLIYKRGYIEEQASPIGITNLVSHERTWSRPGMQGADTVAPLYLYHEDGSKTPNFNPDELKKLTINLSSALPEDVFDYIYAVLHSRSYNSKYSEYLNIDFPRVPIPGQLEFDRLVPLGRELRELHLMEPSVFNVDSGTTFPVVGDNVVVKASFVPDSGGQKDRVVGRVYINDKQYFGNVSGLAWNFYIGGYQPAQKWLKDREGRVLSNMELDHYQKMIRALVETDRIMKEIG